jgi:hypothetical protein
MPSTRGGNEVIHVALGDVACEISTHLFNLQGLAGTTLTDGSANDSENTSLMSPTCEIDVTHEIYRNVYVPRAVLVGRGMHSRTLPYESMPTTLDWSLRPEVVAATTAAKTGWSGRIETISPDTQSNGKPMYDSHDGAQLEFLRQATALAWADDSRYRAPTNSHAEKRQPSTFSSTGRQVNWDDESADDEGDEMDNVQPDQSHYSRRDAALLRQSQEALNAFWNGPEDRNAFVDDSSAPPQQPPPKTARQHHWSDYLMPPYHPDMHIEPSLNGFGGEPESYYAALNDTAWLESSVWERVRRRLEACDSCQGLVLMESSAFANQGRDGGAAACGWSTALLRTWRDECPHSCTWTIHSLDNDQGIATEPDDSLQQNNVDSEQDSTRWMLRQRTKTRHDIQQALVVADQTELSNIYLPLHLPSSGTGLRSHDSALVAAALEGATLPYRLSDRHCHGTTVAQHQQLALQSYYSGSYHGTQPYGTAPNLSYREFVRTLQRAAASRNVLELDTVRPWSDASAEASGVSSSLAQKLQRGTSLERDWRMRQPGYDGGIHRARDQLPGEWMNSTRTSAGLLSQLSPVPAPQLGDSKTDSQDRSHHQHFALLTALRPAMVSSTVSTDVYIRSIMESTGIRYRPEQAMCAVVQQSLSQLTENGYGAGSYWPSIFQHSGGLTAVDGRGHAGVASLVAMPVLSVLGNSTRVHAHLHSVASLAENIVSPFRGRPGRTFSQARAAFLRDVGTSTLPEIDDCVEAVASCLDLRDSYEPSSGSGFQIDDGEPF